ncbi:MAG: nucleotidyltransferase family protein [Sulfurimonas sp.]
MIKVDDVRLSLDATIKESLEKIDQGAIKIAVILDNDDTLLGVITDGDIRRALLKGLTLESPIKEIVQTNPVVCHIDETKEQVLAKVLGKRIYHLPVLDVNSRVVGIQDVESLLKGKKRSNKVVLMVGGLGTRLRPLTEDTPKPMLKVGNRPILETIILNFKQYGFEEFILSVNYKADIVKSYFGNGERFGVDIAYVSEEKRMGTAGALSLMKEHLTEPFFVMNGDLLTNVNFEHFLNFHHENSSVATMAVREYEYQIPFGVINQESGEIRSIVEKPKQRHYVNAGIYILNPEVLGLIPNDTFYDMPTLFEDLIRGKQKPISFPVHEYWLDIGQIDELHQARAEYFNVFEG